MRLAAFEDSAYRRDGDVLTTRRAFPRFLWALGEEVDALVVMSRLDPEPGRDHYVVDVPDGASFVPLPHYPALTDVAAVARALPATVRLLWRTLGGVDAVWVNGPSPVAILIAVLGVLRRRRVVLGVRQDTREYARRRHPGRRAAQAAFRAMDVVWRLLARRLPITLVGQDLHDSFAAAPRRHLLTVSFVTEADLAAPGDRPAPVDGDLRLLTVGRLEAEKNPLLLADVLAELGDGYRLTIVGEGPLEAQLRARLTELGVADRAELVGYVPLDDGLFDRYRAADGFLHVSWTEGLPQVLVEAFASRTPVVATAVGGVPAIAAGAALLVPPGDAPAAAAAIKRLAGDAGLRERLVEAGFSRARERTAEAERRRLLDFIASA